MAARALKQRLPSDRTYDSVLRHFEVERNIASRLRAANRDERKAIYRTMYEELFAAVPDHPRLTRRADPKLTQEAIRSELGLLGPFIRGADAVLEFGAGDCRLAFQVAEHVRKVYAVEISDQRGNGVRSPDNFELVIYDGYELNLPRASVDVVFSNQLIEHLHPEDTEDHFRLVHGLLRDGGAYVFRTPHRYAGPTDVSKYFSDEPEGFHLKEWTCSELGALLKSIGYRSCNAYRTVGDRCFRLPFFIMRAYEALLAPIPAGRRRRAAGRIMSTISMAAFK